MIRIILKSVLSLLSFKFSCNHTLHLYLVLILLHDIHLFWLGNVFSNHCFALFVSDWFLLSNTEYMLTTWIDYVGSFWIYELFLKVIFNLNKFFVCGSGHLHMLMVCSFRLGILYMLSLVFYWKDYFVNLMQSLSLSSLIRIERGLWWLVISTFYCKHLVCVGIVMRLRKVPLEFFRHMDTCIRTLFWRSIGEDYFWGNDLLLRILGLRINSRPVKCHTRRVI